MNNLKKIYLLVFFIMMVFPSIINAQAHEYTIKAIFLERFTRFVEWPEESLALDTSQPFIIGIIGDTPLKYIVKEIYSSQKIKDKEVKIHFISNNIKEIKKCHLLFITKSQEKNLSKILSYTSNKPILTVSDTDGFADKGVLINFYIQENKVRFEINKSAVKKSGLYMSHMLYKLAKVIKNN